MLYKFITVLLVFCFFTVGMQAQKQTSNWFFGNKVGLNFNNNPPSPDYSGNAFILEGSSVVSDFNGNLLFYSDGLRVFNRNHEVMSGGDHLLGNPTSTSNSLIAYFPGNDSIYYLFTIGGAGRTDEGLRFNVIHMNRDHGLGEVVQKNVLIESNTFEKLAAVRHCNGKDIWLTIKIWNTDEFHTYLLTESGLSPTYQTFHSGLTIDIFSSNMIGQIKFSADGSKLAAVYIADLTKVELINFNNATGVLYSPVVFDPYVQAFFSETIGPYGLAFSPNGRLLYISASIDRGEESVLFQFDISSMNAASIVASKQQIARNTPYIGSALQEAPDGKIYFTQNADSSLSVINNPDVYGSGCNFRYHAVFLGQNTTSPLQYGLPTFVSSDVNREFVPYDFFYTRNCEDLAVTFHLNRTNGVDSVRWFFHDGTESVLFEPVYNYPMLNDYPVKVKIYYRNCATGSSVLEHSVNLNPPYTDFLGLDTTFCRGLPFSFLLKPSVTADRYLWNNGSRNSAILITEPGEYWLEITKNNCVYRDTFRVWESTAPPIYAGKDTFVCAQKPIVLVATGNADTLIWSTGGRNNITVSAAGQYILYGKNISGCNSSDTVNVSWGNCPFLLPNAFTPNGDHINDYFFILNGFLADDFRMYVYDRYGRMVYHSSDMFQKWDGTFKGKPVMQGVYTWQVTYRNQKKLAVVEKGTVMLIR